MSSSDALAEAFASNPDDVRAFEALEEQHFLGAEWDALATLYRQRLAAPSLEETGPERARVQLRLAQMLEERLLDTDAAIEAYWAVAKLDPTCRPALRQLRRIHTERQQWDLVLQIAELEGQIAMESFERAAFLAEMGEVWRRHLGDAQQALSCFERALETDPGQQDAVRGLARSLEALGRAEAAVEAWEKLVELQRGPDRASALVALGSLLASRSEGDRAVECYRRALTDDPRNQDAVEALVVQASAMERWPLLADLYERRFDLAAGARRRTAIAIEAGRLQLERLDNPQAARLWLRRALELCPEEISVHQALADLERRTGNDDALCDALEQVISLAEGELPVGTLVEAAELQSERGNEAQSAAYLQRALANSPDDPIVLELLSDSLSKLGRFAELADTLERRAALAGDDLELRAGVLVELARLHAGEFDDSDAARDAWARAFLARPDTPGVASELVRLYRKDEAWTELRSVLATAASEGPDAERGDSHCALGELLLEHFDEPEEARRAFQAALDLDAQSLRALEGLGRIASDSGDEDAMLVAHEREAAVTTDRARLAALVWSMVPLLEARDRSQDALDWVERLVDAAPDDCEALEASARLNEQLGHAEAFTTALERLDGKLSGAQQTANRLRLARACLDAERHDEAIGWYEQCVEIGPADRGALEELVAAYRAANRLPEQARAQRRLAELLPEDERQGCLQELAALLEDPIGDLESAIVVLWQLVDAGAGREAEASLERLLERTRRYEELAQHLDERRRRAQGDDANALDLRRARLRLDQLSQYDEAAELFGRLRELDAHREEATAGLESALRATNDASGLVHFLAEKAEETADPGERVRIELERAVLLDEVTGAPDEAREALERLCAQEIDADVSREAIERLERLLEREGDWASLRERLEAALPGADTGAQLALRERLAALCRDRLADRDAAIVHLEEIGRLEPGRAPTWHNLALLYQATGRHADQLRVIEAELATQPADERALGLRARAARLCAAALDDPEGACAHYEAIRVIDPGHPEAAEFLLSYYERSDEPERMVPLLEARLASLVATGEEPGAADADARRAERTSLRVRVAGLHAGALEEPATAIAALEDALAEEGPIPAIAEPLADLYQREHRAEALIELCRRTIASCDVAAERAGWRLRMADALRDSGDADGAIDAYRGVLEDRPDASEARAALRELYRREERSAELASLLQEDLAGSVADAEKAERVPLLLELAELLAGPVGQPEQALVELRRVLEIDPTHNAALASARALAEQLGRSTDLLELIESALERAPTAHARARLHEQRGDLLGAALEQPTQAAAAYREALLQEPTLRSARSALRSLLEAQGNWNGALDCLFLEAQSASGDERRALYEQAARTASEHVDADAALPWLERLRADWPEDAGVLARIAELHRQAGRPEALLRALDEQLALCSDDAARRGLNVDRAHVLEHDLDSPGRALVALEAAQRVAPRDAAVLRELARLQSSLGRIRDHAATLEALLDVCDEDERIGLLQTLAEVHGERLADPQSACEWRGRALEVLSPDAPQRADLLRARAEDLRTLGRAAAWIDTAEQELALRGDDPARRAQLHEQLAHAHAQDLANTRAALNHWGELVRLGDADATCMDADGHERAELGLLDALRTSRAHGELERRLAARLERGDGDASGWLELAHLRDERLHRPAAAAQAFRCALELEAASLPALRGLRATSERLGDWETVANTLDLELEHRHDAGDSERGALLRRLGELAWRRLDARPRAIEAFRRAIEIDERDWTSVRALQQLLEAEGDWEAAVSLHEDECDRLGEEQPERRLAAWLRAGELARDRCGDPQRALRAYERAAVVAPLPAKSQREWAALYAATDAPERHVEELARWCDDADAGANAEDHLELSEALAALGRTGDALARARHAARVEDSSLRAWDAVASLAASGGEPEAAADALERSADLSQGSEAAERLVRAAALVEADAPERAASQLRRAIASDAGSPVPRAQLALVAERLEAWEESSQAAGAALDLAGESGLGDEVRLATALAGGRSARESGSLDAAALFFAAALGIDPAHPEGLTAAGEVLFESGDAPAARALLEQRLELAVEDPARAQHLAMVGAGLELAGRDDDAIARYREAIEVGADRLDAHEGLARLHAAAGRADEAIAAMGAWAEALDDPKQRAGVWLRAARIESERGDWDATERRLRAALADDATASGAWIDLAEGLWQRERSADALAAATDALAHVEDLIARARLALVRAEVLEGEQRDGEAAEAWAEVARCDTRCARAALAQARLLRAAGEWREAARALQDFAAAHPEATHIELAPVYEERARILAGPLEDVEEAISCYARALELDPALEDARAQLASLLAHVPGREGEAIQHHCELLERNPVRTASIRALLRAAERAGGDEQVAGGLALLRAIGAASPEERERAAGALPFGLGGGRMDDPTFEAARAMAREAARDLAAIADLEADDSLAAPGAGDLAGTLAAAEIELAAPWLPDLDADELREALTSLAALALDRSSGSEGRVTAALEQNLGRRALKRVRKALGAVTFEAVQAIDPEAWRAELRAMAAAAAVDRHDRDLRAALVLLAHPESVPNDSDDLSARLSDEPAARRLLARAVGSWARRVTGKAG